MRLPDKSSGSASPRFSRHNRNSAASSRGGKCADPLYQHLVLTAEKKFWRCVENGEPPRLFGVEPPRPRIEAVRIVDMSASNAWAEFAGVFAQTRAAHLEHEQAKSELKASCRKMPRKLPDMACGPSARNQVP
jgi:hypothetical protein